MRAILQGEVDLKGVGRIYQQIIIDTYAKVAFAKLYGRETRITAAEMLNDRVVPFYDEHAIRYAGVDRSRHRFLRRREPRRRALPEGRGYRSHPRTKAKSPQTGRANHFAAPWSAVS